MSNSIEFVVLIDNSANPEDKFLNTDDVEMLKILLDEVSVKIAVKIATRLTGKKKNELCCWNTGLSLL